MPAESHSHESATTDDAGNFFSLVISSIIVAVCVLFWQIHEVSPTRFHALLFTFSQVAVISVVIWQVCEPFADAAQWVGQRFRLPGSVRGATLDAVASSMPELFSGIFFVVVAISAALDGDAWGAANPSPAVIQAGAEGFGSTIATCAGSAVYNMILIPAFCALVISFTRPERPTIDVEDEVISRDGIWFLSCQILLVMFLYQHEMMWWMGVCFLALYAVYIGQLYFDAKLYRKKMDLLQAHLMTHGVEVKLRDVISDMKTQGVRVSPALVMKAQDEFTGTAETDESEPITVGAGVFFNYFRIPLNGITTCFVLLISTVLVAAACYFLVEATINTARILDVPAFFVAVILAAAASSVPDTFLAIAAARRGDDSGAVSNAFGSNIFDICICLSIPLLVNAWLTGWEPVSLMQGGEPIPGLVGLRILLVALTIVNLAIMWHNRQITRGKAVVMCLLYVVFVGYAVLGSMGILA